MNANFKIVWFEDEELFEFRNKIEEKIKEYSLIPQIEKYIGKQYSIDTLKAADLILADFDLQSNLVNGVTIVNDIRKENIVTDVIFYSSKFDAMLKAIKDVNPLMEGIFCAKRGRGIGDNENNFDRKLSLLIDRIVKRSESSENLRGMLLEYATNFEYQINRIIIEFCSQSSENLNNVCSYINSKVAHNVKEKTNKLCSKLRANECKDCCFVPLSVETLEDIKNNRYELYTRSRILNYILTILEAQKRLGVEYRTFHKDFNNDVIIFRNALAHQKTTEKRLYIQKNHSFIDINQETFILLRKNIKKYCEKLNYLEKKVL